MALRSKKVKGGTWVTLEKAFNDGRGLKVEISEPVGAKIKMRWGLPYLNLGWDTQEQTLDGKNRYVSSNPSETIAYPRAQIKVKESTTVWYERHDYDSSDEYLRHAIHSNDNTDMSRADNLHKDRITIINDVLRKITDHKSFADCDRTSLLEEDTEEEKVDAG